MVKCLTPHFLRSRIGALLEAGERALRRRRRGRSDSGLIAINPAINPEGGEARSASPDLIRQVVQDPKGLH